MKHEVDKHSEAIRIAEPFLKLKNKLTEQKMPVSYVMENLGICKMNVVYWSSKHMSSKTGIVYRTHNWQPILRKRMWRRYSFVDLILFELVSYLRNIQMPLARCKQLRDWLSVNLLDGELLIFELTAGEPVNVLISGKGVIESFSKTKKLKDPDAILNNQQPAVIVPLYPCFRKILEIIKNAKRDDFWIKFVRDKSGSKNKAIYYVPGAKIELKRP